MVKKSKPSKNSESNKQTSSGVGVKKVNWVLCLILSIFVGALGVDRFMMGKVGTGILKLITFGGLGVWWLIDVILIATKYNYEGVSWQEE